MKNVLASDRRNSPATGRIISKGATPLTHLSRACLGALRMTERRAAISSEKKRKKRAREQIRAMHASREITRFASRFIPLREQPPHHCRRCNPRILLPLLSWPSSHAAPSPPLSPSTPLLYLHQCIPGVSHCKVNKLLPNKK